MRLRAFLAMWIALALAVSVTALASGRLDEGGRAADQVVSAPGPAVQREADETLRPGQMRVQGTVTAARLTGAVLEPRTLPVPLTVHADRGFGNGGSFTGVTVGGGTASVVWDGGRPLALSGEGGLLVDPVEALLVPEGVRLGLGGVVHRLASGGYRIDTPVAVGTSGVATPRDSVDFEAHEGTRFEAKGNAHVVLALDAPRRLRGPGRIELQGDLMLTDRAGTRPTTSLTVDHAAYDLTLAGGAAGVTIAGLVDVAGGS